MAIRVEEYVVKGNEFIHQVAKQLQDPEDIDHAKRVIVSVLHTLREILTPEESIHLMAQLPLYIKAAYADGWKIPSKNERPGTLKTFMECIRSQDNHAAEKDFADNQEGLKNVQAVFDVLRKYVSQGEIDRVIKQLPIEFADPEIESFTLKP